MKAAAWVVGVWLAVALTANAGDQLSVRLVRASNDLDGVGAGLGDVAATLQKSLVFKGYAKVAQASTGLPAAASLTLGDYTVKLKGPQSGMDIEVRQGKRQLLKTNARLGDGKPLILGGFPAASDKMILVFLAR